ncbi:MAG TPA: hypothetical protein VM074_01385 [Solimonas sp.]|nr:hypothetical protein [Solimonas sp.]
MSTRSFLAVALAMVPLAALAIPEGPAYPSPEWAQREQANYARTGEGPAELLANPDFLLRWQEQGVANQLEWLQRGVDDSSWFLPTSGNTQLTPLCASWGMQCVGDPFRYPGVDPFYDTVGEVTPFVIYDEGCARISGRVWKPRNPPAGLLPGVVIENGSIQAPETLYWWMAQALVRAGYVVLTFDPRGQGRSDQQTPSGEQGSNANSAVFWLGLVNVIDFFRSGPVVPYPHNIACAGTYPTEVTAFNPYYASIDPERLGIAGHSLGATGVSTVQGYGATGADPWPGLLDQANPVDVAVAWDSLNASAVPRVPAMGQSSEYGIGGAPFREPPDPEAKKLAYGKWVAAGVPVYQITIQGSTHFEWSLLPTFPATSWCPQMVDGTCSGGWGNPMAEHYSLAWLDRWLKKPGEPGYDDADARLLADADWQERYSFYLRSARSFPTRGGVQQVCDDIRAGCAAAAAPASATSAFGGGALPPLLLAGLLAVALRRRSR